MWKNDPNQFEKELVMDDILKFSKCSCGEWIKCTERLPEDGVHVLVYDKTEGICRGYLQMDCWNHYPMGSYASDACLFSVTHWMPLPNLPKDE